MRTRAYQDQLMVGNHIIKIVIFQASRGSFQKYKSEIRTWHLSPELELKKKRKKKGNSFGFLLEVS